MKIHALKLLRNFFPAIIGFVGGVYFTAKYFDGLPKTLWEWEVFRAHSIPPIYNPFYIAVAFFVLGLLSNLLWIFVLAKWGVDE